MENSSDKNIFSIGVDNFKKGEFKIALDYFKKLLINYPENTSLLENIALTEYNLKNLYECELILKKIIKLNKNSKRQFNFLLKVLREEDKIEELKKLIDIGIKSNQIDKKFSIIKNILFPFINKNNKEIQYFRNNANEYLNNFLSSSEEINLEIDKQSLDPPIFNYSYDQFDNLELNKKFVKLFKKIYPNLNQEVSFSKKNSEKIKIGFISEYFTNHTIGKLFKGTIFNLNQDKFDIKIFHLHKTKKSKIFSEFLEKEINLNLKNITLPKQFNEKVEIIKKNQLDIIFYPDIGMSAELYFLTFLRLAKYQIVSWGHPISTGNPNIDFFLSSKKSEDESAQKNYSEKLILLEHMLYYYKPTTSLKLDLEEMNKPNIYSCPQTLFKIHPEFDEIINQILTKDKNAKIYFIKDTNKVLFKKLIERFKERLGSNIDRIIFLEKLSYEKFLNHCGSASVLLDPIYYGGGNSFYESMYYGTPTVTLPTDHLKCRLTLGAYNQMEVEDIPMVNSAEEYVNKAIEIANLKPKKMLDLKKYYSDAAFNKLYENKKYTDELENFLFNLF